MAKVILARAAAPAATPGTTASPTSHRPIMVPHVNARELKVHLDFRKGSSLFFYDEQTKTWHFNDEFIADLANYSRTIQVVDLVINFRHTRNESVERKVAQAQLISDAAKAFSKFDALTAFNIKVEMEGNFAWGQFKNLACFYQMKFGGWTCNFVSKDNERRIEELQVGSPLDIRLRGWFKYLRARNKL